MRLTQFEIDTIRRGWAHVRTLKAYAGNVYFKDLFDLAPDVERLFTRALDLHARKLIEALDFVVENLDREDILMPVLADLGVRHAGYGVRPSHYEAMGDALLNMLEKTIGPSFDDEDARAWARLYLQISDVMVDAGARVRS